MEKIGMDQVRTHYHHFVTPDMQKGNGMIGYNAFILEFEKWIKEKGVEKPTTGGHGGDSMGTSKRQQPLDRTFEREDLSRSQIALT